MIRQIVIQSIAIADNLTVDGDLMVNTVKGRDAYQLTIDHNLTVNGELVANTTRALDTDQLTVSDNLTVDGALVVNTVKGKDADQLTIDDNLHVVGELVANTMRALDADQLAVNDSLAVGPLLDVSGDEVHVGAGVQFIKSALSLGFIATINHNFGALIKEVLRNSESDTSGSSSYTSDFSIK
jgi:hypothetical protein